MHQKKEKCEKLSDYGFIQKFPFHEYYNDDYDKEHVHATHSESLSSGIEWKDWSTTILRYLRKLPQNEMKGTLKRMSQEYEQAYCVMRKVEKLSFSKKDDENNKDFRDRQNSIIVNQFGGKEGFAKVFNAVTKAIEQDTDNEEDFKQNSIGNLALLNRGINRGKEYAAAPFAVKSAIIKDKIAKGKFVPAGTKIMFDKSFRTLPTEMYHWRKSNYSDGKLSDREEFIEYIISTIMKCLPYEKRNN